MAHKLPIKLQTAIQELHGKPLEVTDDFGTTYVVVLKEAYIHLSNLCLEADSAIQNELRKLIQLGVESGPGIPSEEVFAELRSIASTSAARKE